MIPLRTMTFNLLRATKVTGPGRPLVLRNRAELPRTLFSNFPRDNPKNTLSLYIPDGRVHAMDRRTSRAAQAAREDDRAEGVVGEE